MRGRFDCSLRGYSHIRISKWRVPFLIQRSVQFLALFWAWRTSRFEKRSFIKRRRLTEYIKCVSVEQEDYMRTSSHLCDQKAVRKSSSAGLITKLALSWKITRMWIDVGRYNRVVCLRPPRLLTSRQDTHEIECGWALSEDLQKIWSTSKTNHMVDGPPEIIMRIAISSMIYFRLFYN